MESKTQYLCLHCGKEHGEHQAKLLHCPKASRSSFNAFDKLHTFSPNYDKPLADKPTI